MKGTPLQVYFITVPYPSFSIWAETVQATHYPYLFVSAVFAVLVSVAHPLWDEALLALGTAMLGGADRRPGAALLV